jgi:hypothetical protein
MSGRIRADLNQFNNYTGEVSERRIVDWYHLTLNQALAHREVSSRGNGEE